MAMATMQSSVVSPIGGCALNRCSSLSPFVGTSLRSAPRVQRKAGLQVRCMAEDNKQEEETIKTWKPKASTINFTDIFAFDGPAPERINGRLAMIGFVAAMGVELSKGSDVFMQISNGGVEWFLGTSILLSVASLVPMFKGVSAEEKSDGVMTSNAEMWNGRFAMLGLVALAITEYATGNALV